MVACISNRASASGVGSIGASASRPDIEGKAVLFKKMAGIDCVELCIDT